MVQAERRLDYAEDARACFEVAKIGFYLAHQ